MLCRMFLHTEDSIWQISKKKIIMFYAKINAVHFAATTATAKEALWGVQLTASEFQLAYLPSSVLSGSSAAMQLSSSSKTDRHSQPFSFFSSKLLLPCHLVKWMVKYHGVAEACSVGWWTQDSLRDREPQTPDITHNNFTGLITTQTAIRALTHSHYKHTKKIKLCCFFFVIVGKPSRSLSGGAQYFLRDGTRIPYLAFSSYHIISYSNGWT